MKFSEINFQTFIQEAVKQLSFEEMTEIQEKCIPLIMQSKDLIGKSQTGSGKTFAYGLPAINMVEKDFKAIQVLIVCPTRELASQVSDELRKVTKLTESIKVVPIFGGANMQRQIEAIKKNAKIVVGTPGRLMDHLRRNTLKLKHLKMVVLDEADEMLNMGFKEDIETILKSVNPEHQTVMFSATMPKPILDLTSQYMKEASFIEIGAKFQLVDTIQQKFVYHEKKEALVALLKQIRPKVGIVFCDTIKMVETATKLLKDNGINAECLHGDMRQSARKKNITALKDGDINVLVGTDVAARGLDIKNVDVVINFDLPHDVEYYIHRIGRTGRAGLNGLAITLISTQSQRKQLAFIEQEIKMPIEQILLPGDKLVKGDKSTEQLGFTKKQKQNGRDLTRSANSQETKNQQKVRTTSSRPYGRSQSSFEGRKASRKLQKPTDTDKPTKEYKNFGRARTNEKKEFRKDTVKDVNFNGSPKKPQNKFYQKFERTNSRKFTDLTSYERNEYTREDDKKEYRDRYHKSEYRMQSTKNGYNSNNSKQKRKFSNDRPKASNYKHK